MCAGVTVFTPLKKYAKQGMTVGVVGVGGLGHLAIKYSAAMKLKTVAISTDKSKEADVKGFGAESLIASKDP